MTKLGEKAIARSVRWPILPRIPRSDLVLNSSLLFTPDN